MRMLLMAVGMGASVVVVVALVVALVLVGVIWAVAKRYRKVPPNVVMVVYGRKRQMREGKVVGYRIVTGGATFIMPLLEEFRTISLNLMQIPLKIENTPNPMSTRTQMITIQ